MKVTLDSFISRNPDILWRIFEGNLIAITPSDSMIHSFNKTGTFIWEFVGKKSVAIREISSEISDRFDINNDNSERDVLKFTKSGIEKGVFVLKK